MTDYSEIDSTLSNSSGAYANALHRARQIAAKINTPNGGNKSLVVGIKRPVEDLPGMDWGGDQGLPNKRQAMSEQNNHPDRSLLTGNQGTMDKTKERIPDMVNRGGNFQDRNSTIEMNIPGLKVGLVIGKNGDTIKNLQERTGVKMVLLQEGINAQDKTLSIKGDLQKAEYARQLVLDLLTDRDSSAGRGFSGGGGGTGRGHLNGFGPMSTSSQEFAVPVTAVGVVIGRGGDMIKKIQHDSGARLQFQQDVINTENGPGERMCIITGMPEQIQIARSILHELISSVLQERDQQLLGRGRGRGRGGMGVFEERRPSMGMHGGRGGPLSTQITYSVPANKCGIVIGKGGDTIRNINQQTGAHAQLSRDSPSNPDEKVFVIRGMPDQIEHAKQLINEKINGGGMPSNFGHPSMGYGQPSHHSFGDNHAYQQWQSQGPPSGDHSKQTADAWAAYYAQYYNQTQSSAQPPSGQPSQAPGSSATSQHNAPATASGGQPDYSAAWLEYYRSMGMYMEYEILEQQVKQSGSQASAGGPPVAQAPQTVGHSGSQSSQHHYDQYGQYDQGGSYSYNYGSYPSHQQ